MNQIAIVDYGVGNLKSITNAMKYLGLNTIITGDPGELEQSDAVILPGVGAFPDAADRLRQSGLDHVVVEQSVNKPVLGICLGMQLLFNAGEEGRDCKGLGLVEGCVKRMITDRKLPHIGWNSLIMQNSSPLFRGLEKGAYVYFVHTYCGVTDREENVIARTDYGVPVVAAVQAGNVFGCQFHPEKSGETGLQILKNFGELNR